MCRTSPRTPIRDLNLGTLSIGSTRVRDPSFYQQVERDEALVGPTSDRCYPDCHFRLLMPMCVTFDTLQEVARVARDSCTGSGAGDRRGRGSWGACWSALPRAWTSASASA